MDRKITKKTAKETLVKVRLQISAGDESYAHGKLAPVEEKFLSSPYAAPITNQILRNMVSTNSQIKLPITKSNKK